MSLEDPFFVVKDEVCKALGKTRGLFQRRLELLAAVESGDSQPPPIGGVSVTSPTGGLAAGVLVVGTTVTAKDELDWTNTELRNSLRSIEWDLEDLEETVSIVEKNPRKFKIAPNELTSRRSFIHQTREEVKCMKNRIASTTKDIRKSIPASSIELEVEITTCNSPIHPGFHNKSGKKMPDPAGGSTKYSRLVNQLDDSPTHSNDYAQAVLLRQQAIMEQQDSQLDDLASSMGVLKEMSQRVGREVDEQAVMLDDFGNEMEHTQSKMNNMVNKIAKVMHLTTDKRQWGAIAILSAVLAVVILLYFIL